MSITSHDPHADDAAAGPHSPGDHVENHGPADGAHGSSDSLGRIDPVAWGAGVVGIAAGLIVAAALAASTGWLG